MNSGFRRVLIDLMCLMGLMALTLPGLPAAAQDLSSDSQDLQSSSNVGFEGSPVSRVDIAVRPSEDPPQIRALIRQEPGKPFSMDAIRSSVAALQQTGKFTQVQVSLEPQAAGFAFCLSFSRYTTSGSFPFREPQRLYRTRACCRLRMFRRFRLSCPIMFPTKRNASWLSSFPKDFSQRAYTRTRKPTMSTGL